VAAPLQVGRAGESFACCAACFYLYYLFSGVISPSPSGAAPPAPCPSCPDARR